ncbi:hypothetical protein PPERSA_02224 [Pseudocohnilembus persalinus]|uniref:Uncharacterized protein n=1 Tax=Pseudocohnilembus persalinus TaxID=266149 RepID=A0A0V0QKG2_PSEPJ|nr:hypothetical protein PPERSA_02224 [Pseudocohnilembus persalinus]|eukprot:KRX02734.1 hypothetical protein PPERSA_02224 [Pseudocohnilembus persalinus]
MAKCLTFLLFLGIELDLQNEDLDRFILLQYFCNDDLINKIDKMTDFSSLIWLFRKNEVNFINVRRFQEFSIKKYGNEIAKDKKIKPYLPDMKDYSKLPSTCTWNVYNTVYEGKVLEKLKEAYTLRNKPEADEVKQKSVKIRAAVLEELQKNYYKSSVADFF